MLAELKRPSRARKRLYSPAEVVSGDLIFIDDSREDPDQPYAMIVADGEYKGRIVAGWRWNTGEAGYELYDWRGWVTVSKSARAYRILENHPAYGWAWAQLMRKALTNESE